MAVVGIDLGTTNTVVACVQGGQIRVVADEEGNRLLPSVVSFHPNGDVLVGQEAKNRRLIDAKNTISSVKRLIGRPWDSDEMRIARSRFGFELREGVGQGALVVARGESYTLPEISAFVLKRARQIAEAALGESVDKAVITVPAFFNELQRASTKVAGRVAGLEVLRILNEPTAAALAYGFGSERTERVVVFDFGGGTFDCSVLDLTGMLFEVLATAGDTFLGGDDLDTSIAEAMCSAFLAQHRYDPRVDPQAFERLRSAAEDVKKALSVEEEIQIDIPDVAHGVEGRALGFRFGMTRADLDAIAAPFVERTLAVTQDALNAARLSATSFDQIILVGGSTRMPLVRRKVSDFFGMPINDRLNAEEVVAIGAAVQGAALIDQTRTRGVPKAPQPGVIGRPQSIEESPRPRERASATPGASASMVPGARVHETLRPKAAVPPPAGPPSTREGARTRPGVAVAPGVDDAPPSFGSNETLPANLRAPGATANFGSPLGPDSIRVRTGSMEDLNETRKRATWGEMNPLETEDISLIGSTVASSPVAPQRSNPPPASGSLSPRGVGVGPLATEDISRIASSPPPRGSPSNRPSGPPGRALSPRGANVGPLPTEDISIIAPGMGPSPSSDVPSIPSLDAGPPSRPQAFSRSAPPVPRRDPSVPPPMPPFPPPPRATSSKPPAPFPQPAAPESFASQISFDVGGVSAPPAPTEQNKPKPPILIDVTPSTLVVETVGSYCDPVIARNSMIPCDQTRVFATSRDLQTTVHVRVAQGEQDRFDANQYLGEVEISNLRPGPRGEVLVSVTFDLDVNGTLLVRAVDATTGQKAQATMKLITVSQKESDIEEMIERSRSHEVKGRSA